MACRRYYEGLCLGGDCSRCKYLDGSYERKSERIMLILGSAFIIIGLFLTVVVAVLL